MNKNDFKKTIVGDLSAVNHVYIEQLKTIESVRANNLFKVNCEDICNLQRSLYPKFTIFLVFKDFKRLCYDFSKTL